MVQILNIIMVTFLIFLLSNIGTQSAAQTDLPTKLYQFSPDIRKGKSFEWEVKNYFYEHTFEGTDRSPSNFINGVLFHGVTDPLFEYHNKYPIEKNGSIYRITITNDIEPVDSFRETIIDGFNVSLDGTNLDIYGINNPSPGVLFTPTSTRWFNYFFTPISIIYSNGTEIDRFGSDVVSTSPDSQIQRMEDFHTTYSNFNGWYPPFIFSLDFSNQDSEYTSNYTRFGCPLDNLEIDGENSCSTISKYNETIFTSSTTWDGDTGLMIRSHFIYNSYRETEDHGMYLIDFEMELIRKSNSDLNLLKTNTAYFIIATLIILNLIRTRKKKNIII